MSFLDKVGLQTVWGKIKGLVSDTTYTKTAIDTALSGKKSTQGAVSDPAASGTGVEFISGISQNAQGVISPSKKTVRTMGGASAAAAGSTGLVPAPAANGQKKYLRGDATWQEPDDSEIASTIDGKSTVEEVLSHHSQQMTDLKTALKSGKEEDAIWHLGFYLDENGDLCQVDEEEDNG